MGRAVASSCACRLARRWSNATVRPTSSSIAPTCREPCLPPSSRNHGSRCILAFASRPSPRMRRVSVVEGMEADQQVRFEGSVLVGADGVRSMVREDGDRGRPPRATPGAPRGGLPSKPRGSLPSPSATTRPDSGSVGMPISSTMPSMPAGRSTWSRPSTTHGTKTAGMFPAIRPRSRPRSGIGRSR